MLLVFGNSLLWRMFRLKVNSHCVSEMYKMQISLQELTGKLPKEIPLAPGEPMPQVRKRVRTGFTLSPQIINHAANVSVHHHSLYCYIKSSTSKVLSGLVRCGAVRCGTVRCGNNDVMQIHSKYTVYIMQLSE